MDASSKLPAGTGIAPPAQNRLGYLDGLRALAALFVVFSHIWILQFGMTPLTGPLGLAGNWLLYSHLAVDLFIVLSGYGLALPVLRDKGLKGGVVTFFSRRIVRILPPYYVGLALGVGVYLIVKSMNHDHHAFNWLALFGNIFLVHDIVLRWNVFNGPLWCIASQWRLYLLFPVSALILLRWGRLPLLVSMTLFGGLLTALIFGYYESAFLSCPWFFSLFAMGMCAASLCVQNPELAKGRRWSLAAIGSLLALIFLLAKYPFDSGRHLPLADIAAGAFVASGLIVLSGGSGLLGRRISTALSWGPLTSLGRVSYSLYLIHSPCLILLHQLLLHTHLYASASLLARAGILVLIGAPLVFILSQLFYKYIETPFAGRRK